MNRTSYVVTTRAPRLTAEQRATLDLSTAQRGTTVPFADWRAVSLPLVAAGLVTWRHGNGGNVLSITPAGRAALAATGAK
jgi:hypothetical protein